jgi:hypothetical protein
MAAGDQASTPGPARRNSGQGTRWHQAADVSTGRPLHISPHTSANATVVTVVLFWCSASGCSATHRRPALPDPQIRGEGHVMLEGRTSRARQAQSWPAGTVGSPG